MNDIFVQAKSILILWIDNVDRGNLPVFQRIIESKAKHAEITSENVQVLLECKIFFCTF
jgi:hypothetical protein